MPMVMDNFEFKQLSPREWSITATLKGSGVTIICNTNTEREAGWGGGGAGKSFSHTQ